MSERICGCCERTGEMQALKGGGWHPWGGAALEPPSLAFPLLLAMCFSGSVRERRNGAFQWLILGRQRYEGFLSIKLVKDFW